MNTNRNRGYSFRLMTLLVVLILGGASIAASLLAQPAAATPATAEPAAPQGDGTEPLPPGATIETVLPNMNYPISMAFDPNGRLFYTEKGGAVRLYANGTLQPAAVITFPANNNFERGLLGIAIDPDFNNNHYIYVFYTASGASENRVVRFVENNGVGSDPITIFTSTQTAGNHVGGNVHFGPDGKLYVTMGDNANAANSQNVTVRNGKIHRINSDGTFPPDNPVFTQTGALPSLYAIGVRNSFDFTFDPLTPGRIFASENGPGCDDEMNRIEAGYNYGWRASYPCDDSNPSPTYNTIAPLWYLGSGSCCEAPTGIFVYTGTQIPQWTGHLFMANYNTGDMRHFYLNPDRTIATTTNTVLGVNANTDLVNGPDGAFWYIEGGGYSIGTLKRIVGSGPTATPTNTLPPSNTPTITPTQPATNTPTVTNTPTNTNTPENTPTGTPPTGTETATATVTVEVTSTATDTPEVTATATATGTVVPCTISFSDVRPSDYFYEPVRYLYCAGVISGYEDNTFRPFNTTTRSQLSKIIVLAEGWALVEPPVPTFNDVPTTNPFYTHIETAYEHEIISGYACGGPGEPCPGLYFRPFLDVTRGQLSKIIVLAEGWAVDTSGGPHFTDVPEGHVFYDVIETAFNHGLISGYNCGGPGEPCDGQNRPYFRWGSNATRGQISKIVYIAVTQE